VLKLGPCSRTHTNDGTEFGHGVHFITFLTLHWYRLGHLPSSICE